MSAETGLQRQKRLENQLHQMAKTHIKKIIDAEEEMALQDLTR